MVAEYSMTRILKMISDLKEELNNPYEQHYDIVGIIKGDANVLSNGVSKEAFADAAKASFDRRIARMENLRKLLSIKGKANNMIYVTIAGKRYTIAEALGYLSSDVKLYYNKFVSDLTDHIRTTKKNVSEYNDRMMDQDKINSYLDIVLGTKNNTDAKRATPEELEPLIKKYQEIYLAHYFDPINADQKLQKLLEMKEFYAEAELELAAANSMAKIRVDLDEDIPVIYDITGCPNTLHEEESN